MKEKADLVEGWRKKAESDLIAVDATIEAGAFDVACFHAQQAVEKLLKAFLCSVETEFPHTHNLLRLVEPCGRHDESFHGLSAVVEPLTPYAVELRYDQEFWPKESVATEARTAAIRVRRHVVERLSG